MQQSSVAIVHTKVVICSCVYKSSQQPQSILYSITVVMYCYLGVIAIVHTKLTSTVVHKIFSVAEGQTIVINCNSANKSCLLQVVHTKAIAALTQFCDFFTLFTFLHFKNHIVENKCVETSYNSLKLMQHESTLSNYFNIHKKLTFQKEFNRQASLPILSFIVNHVQLLVSLQYAWIISSVKKFGKCLNYAKVKCLKPKKCRQIPLTFIFVFKYKRLFRVFAHNTQVEIGRANAVARITLRYKQAVDNAVLLRCFIHYSPTWPMPVLSLFLQFYAVDRNEQIVLPTKVLSS